MKKIGCWFCAHISNLFDQLTIRCRINIVKSTKTTCCRYFNWNWHEICCWMRYTSTLLCCWFLTCYSSEQCAKAFMLCLSCWTMIAHWVRLNLCRFNLAFGCLTSNRLSYNMGSICCIIFLVTLVGNAGGVIARILEISLNAERSLYNK